MSAPHTTPVHPPAGRGPPGAGKELDLLKYVFAHPKLDQVRGNPDAVLDLFEEFCAKEGNMMDVGRGKGNKINEYIMESKPKVMAEYGVYYGFSAILFASTMKKASPNDKSLKYWSLEADPVFASIAGSFINLAGLSDIVTVVIGPATQSLTRLKAEGHVKELDFLFIDHWKDLYLQDIKITESLGVLHSGTYIVADNTAQKATEGYLEYVRHHQGWQSAELPTPSGKSGETRVDNEVTKVL